MDQLRMDNTLIELDGTANKSRLGANAILGCQPRRGKGRGQKPVAALPLCRRRQRALMPVPMMNIVNGGAHADNPIDIQEFMVMPVGAPSFAEAVRWGSEIFHTLKKLLKDGAITPTSAMKAVSRPISIRRMRRSASSCAPARKRATCRARMWRSPSIRPRRNSTKTANMNWWANAKRSLRADGELLRRSLHTLSDCLHRGRHGRGRFRRLGNA